jgi:hypothetical protein
MKEWQSRSQNKTKMHLNGSISLLAEMELYVAHHSKTSSDLTNLKGTFPAAELSEH